MAQFIPVIIALLALFLAKFAWEDLQVLRGGSVTVMATATVQASRQTTAGGSMSSRGGSPSGFQATSWSAVYRFTAPVWVNYTGHAPARQSRAVWITCSTTTTSAASVRSMA